LRRRLAGGGAQRDFPILEELAIAGATDYHAELIPVGMVTEAFPDNGIGFSFATDHPDGFGNDDLQLIEAVLPAVSLAIVSDAEHTIAAGLLAAYLGSDVGRRVHAGVVERGSVESIRAVLWYGPQLLSCNGAMGMLGSLACTSNRTFALSTALRP
jgi:adenylate cyclase